MPLFSLNFRESSAGHTVGTLLAMLRFQEERNWVVDTKTFQQKKHVLAYAGRYARRPPIAQHRFLSADRNLVTFTTKDTRLKQNVVDTYSTVAFLRALADHTPDRGRHNIRYFGLLSPRTKSAQHSRVFALLGQRVRPKPARRRWAAALERSFGSNPLRDSIGRLMRWSRRLPATS